MAGLGAVSEPSMEEILASIRRIIAEDTDGPRLAPPGVDSAPTPRPDETSAFAAAITVTDGESDFELPSILRSSSAPAVERGSGVLNRLADALLGAPSVAAPVNRAAELSRSLEDDLADLLEGAGAARSPVASPPPVRVPSIKRSSFEGSAPPPGPPVATPEAQRLFASLDESLALLTDTDKSRDLLRDLASRAPLLSVGEGGSPVPDPPVGFAEAASKAAPTGSVVAPTVAPPLTAPTGGDRDDAAPAKVIATPPPTSAPRAAPPALAELDVRQRGGNGAKPPPLPKAKPSNGASSEPLHEEKRRHPGSEGPVEPLPTKPAAPTPTPPVAAAPAPTAPSPGERMAELQAAPPFASASAEAMERTRASVISAAEFFINGVAGKQGASAGAANATSGAGALDAVAAELLRPMLRQWLAENMPRIMEAALRAEISKTTDPTGKG